MGHQFPHRLPAVGCLVGLVRLANLPPRRPQRQGQRPGRQLARLDIDRYGAPGHIFLYQSITSSRYDKSPLGQSVPKGYRSSRPGSGTGLPRWAAALSLTSLQAAIRSRIFNFGYSNTRYSWGMSSRPW